MLAILRTMPTIVWALLCTLFLINEATNAFVVFPATTARNSVCVFSESAGTATALAEGTSDDDDDDDDDEWEYEEFENLEEQDFYNSEWKIGTCFDDNPDEIKETWCRLIIDEKGNNVCVWGDGGDGKWKFDVASQFLQLSKESFGGWLGKRLWAGVVDDFYFIKGTVRGWGPLQPANVMAQWQAKRLGVDPKEAGAAPWFEEESSSDESLKIEKAGDEESSETQTSS